MNSSRSQRPPIHQQTLLHLRTEYEAFTELIEIFQEFIRSVLTDVAEMQSLATGLENSLFKYEQQIAQVPSNLSTVHPDVLRFWPAFGQPPSHPRKKDSLSLNPQQIDRIYLRNPKNMFNE